MIHENFLNKHIFRDLKYRVPEGIIRCLQESTPGINSSNMAEIWCITVTQSQEHFVVELNTVLVRFVHFWTTSLDLLSFQQTINDCIAKKRELTNKETHHTLKIDSMPDIQGLLPTVFWLVLGRKALRVFASRHETGHPWIQDPSKHRVPPGMNSRKWPRCGT